MCSTHLGDAQQPIGTRTLATHQLEVESEGINESAYYTGYGLTVITMTQINMELNVLV